MKAPILKHLRRVVDEGLPIFAFGYSFYQECFKPGPNYFILKMQDDELCFFADAYDVVRRVELWTAGGSEELQGKERELALAVWSKIAWELLTTK